MEPGNNPADTLSVYSPTQITVYTLDQSPEIVFFENDDHGNPLIEQSAGKYRIVSTYDAHGNVLTHLTQQWRGETWDDSIFHTRTYNSSGGITHIMTDQITTGAVSHARIGFNSSSQETDYLFQYFSRDSLFSSHRSSRQYSIDGKLISIVTESLREGIFQKSDSLSPSYGSNGKRSRENSFTWSTDTWKNRSRTDYRYNDTGGVTHTQMYHWIQDAWVLFSDSEREYDARGNFAGSSVAFGSMGVLTDSSYLGYRTDEAGNLIQVLDEKFKEGRLTSRKRTLSTYDEFRNPMTTEAEAFANGSWSKIHSGLILKFKGRNFYRSDCYRLEAKYSKYLN